MIKRNSEQNSIGNGQDVQIPPIIPTVHQSEALRRYLIIAPPNPLICHFQWRQDKESVMHARYLSSHDLCKCHSRDGTEMMHPLSNSHGLRTESDLQLNPSQHG